MESCPTSGEADRTYCVACKSELMVGATLCPVCKSYQSRWKRVLYHIAAIGGLVTVVISLLTYMAVTFPTIWKTITWKDSVEIIAFNTDKHLVVQNVGEGDVFVSYMSFKSGHLGFSRVEHVNKIIKERSFLVHEIESKDPRSVDKNWHTLILSDDQWKSLTEKFSSKDNCYRWIVYHQSDPHFQNMRQFQKENLRTLPVDGVLFFHSGKDGHRIEQRVSLIAVPFKSPHPACAQQDP